MLHSSISLQRKPSGSGSSSSSESNSLSNSVSLPGSWDYRYDAVMKQYYYINLSNNDISFDSPCEVSTKTQVKKKEGLSRCKSNDGANSKFNLAKLRKTLKKKKSDSSVERAYIHTADTQQDTYYNKIVDDFQLNSEQPAKSQVDLDRLELRLQTLKEMELYGDDY